MIEYNDDMTKDTDSNYGKSRYQFHQQNNWIMTRIISKLLLFLLCDCHQGGMSLQQRRSNNSIFIVMLRLTSSIVIIIVLLIILSGTMMSIGNKDVVVVSINNCVNNCSTTHVPNAVSVQQQQQQPQIPLRLLSTPITKAVHKQRQLQQQRQQQEERYSLLYRDGDLKVTVLLNSLSRWLLVGKLSLNRYQGCLLVNAFTPTVQIRMRQQTVPLKRTLWTCNTIPIQSTTTLRTTTSSSSTTTMLYYSLKNPFTETATTTNINQNSYNPLFLLTNNRREHSDRQKREQGIRMNPITTTNFLTIRQTRFDATNKAKKEVNDDDDDDDDDDNESSGNTFTNVFRFGSNFIQQQRKNETNDELLKNNKARKSNIVKKKKDDDNDNADSKGFFGFFKGSSNKTGSTDNDIPVERIKKRYIVRGIFENTFNGIGSTTNTTSITKLDESTRKKIATTTTTSSNNPFKKFLPFLDKSDNDDYDSNQTIQQKKAKRDDGNETNILTSLQKYTTSVMEGVPKFSLPNMSIGNLFNNNNNNTAASKNRRREEEWIVVMSKTRISPGEMVPVTVAGGIDLLVIASNDGRRLYCIANSCPHLGTPFETGTLTRLPKEEGDQSTILTFSKRTLTTSKSSTSTSSSSKKVDTDSRNDNDDIDDDDVSIFSNNMVPPFTETTLSDLLQQDGCEDCIVCPLHRTAFALESGQVRGEWCPYPPIIGKVVGAVKQPTSAAVFDIRTRGKNIEVRLNTPII